MKNKPSIQSAFKMTNFIVSKINMETLDLIKYKKEDLKLSIQVSIGFSEKNKKIFSIGYQIRATDQNKLIQLKIKATAFFETINNLKMEDKNLQLLKVNAGAIGFPFVRSFINTLTTNAGFPPLILPTINFTKLN